NKNFESVYHNATDYIASLQSAKADELMQTDAFILYKDRMIDYLRDFIRDLQKFSSAIEEHLKHLDKRLSESVIAKIEEYELDIPRLDRVLQPEELKEEIKSRWDNLSRWFLGFDGDESEAYRLLSATNEIIRKITRFAARLAENRSRSLNRKQDYLKLAKFFADCKDENACHKLSAAVFGAFNTRHLAGEFERETESINSGVWEEKPVEFIIKPKIRNYSDGTATDVIPDQSQAKVQKLKEYMKVLQEEQAIMDSLIKSNKIVLADLPEVEPFVRTTLLRWIGKAIWNGKRTSKTDDGRIYRVCLPKSDERIWLRCTDGNINMPAFIIEFQDLVI
ncbi:MAG: TIGR02677 family protein, partial [Thermoanaerobacteraceae bacterium]|nr:TIGR02677 family protein [Thermoanaerobacteraceae bacterium]